MEKSTHNLNLINYRRLFIVLVISFLIGQGKLDELFGGNGMQAVNAALSGDKDAIELLYQELGDVEILDQYSEMIHQAYYLGENIETLQAGAFDTLPQEGLLPYYLAIQSIADALVDGEEVNLFELYPDVFIEGDHTSIYAVTIAYIAGFWGIDLTSPEGIKLLQSLTNVHNLSSEEFAHICGEGAGACAGAEGMFFGSEDGVNSLPRSYFHENFHHTLEQLHNQNYHGAEIESFENETTVLIDSKSPTDSYIAIYDDSQPEVDPLGIEMLGSNEFFAEIWRMVSEKGLDMNRPLRNIDYLTQTPEMRMVPELVQVFATDLELRNEYIDAYVRHDMFALWRVVGEVLLIMNPGYIQDFHTMLSDSTFRERNDVLAAIYPQWEMIEKIPDPRLVAGVLFGAAGASNTRFFWADMEGSYWQGVAYYQMLFDMADPTKRTIIWVSRLDQDQFLNRISIDSYEPNSEINSLVAQAVLEQDPTLLHGQELEAVKAVVYNFMQLFLPDGGNANQIRRDIGRIVVFNSEQPSTDSFMESGVSIEEDSIQVDTADPRWVEKLIYELVQGRYRDHPEIGYVYSEFLNIYNQYPDRIDLPLLFNHRDFTGLLFAMIDRNDNLTQVTLDISIIVDMLGRIYTDSVMKLMDPMYANPVANINILADCFAGQSPYCRDNQMMNLHGGNMLFGLQLRNMQSVLISLNRAIYQAGIATVEDVYRNAGMQVNDNLSVIYADINLADFHLAIALLDTMREQDFSLEYIDPELLADFLPVINTSIEAAVDPVTSNVTPNPFLHFENAELLITQVAKLPMFGGEIHATGVFGRLITLNGRSG